MGFAGYTIIKSPIRITDKMLTSQLRELEADGYIHREVYAVVPPPKPNTH